MHGRAAGGLATAWLARGDELHWLSPKKSVTENP